MFANLDFYQIQIKLSATTTFAAKPIPDDKETDDEVLVTNGPIGEVDDPKDLNNQPTDIPTNS